MAQLFVEHTCRCPQTPLYLLSAIMKFMGDYPMKGQSEQEVISTILKVRRISRLLEVNMSVE